MNKLISSIVLLFVSLAHTAEAQSFLILKKGQEVQVETKVTTDTDMGMGISMKNNSTLYHSVRVLDSYEQGYVLQSTLKRMVMEMEGMGQQETYDSDKAADRDSEIGKSIPNDLFQPDTSRISRTNGSLQDDKPKSPEKENPMEELMTGMAGAEDAAVIREMSFFIPDGKKTGSQWQDSVVEKGLKRNRIYTLVSMNNDQAEIQLVEKTVLNTETETQGMTLQINMNGTTQGQIFVNPKTKLVSKKAMNADIQGTLEMMGQQTAISSKTSTVQTYVYP